MLDLIILPLRADTKKKALEELCRLSAPIARLDNSQISRAIFERERIGSTGIGFGVAVPHACLENLDKTVCAFARLAAPDEYERGNCKIYIRSRIGSEPRIGLPNGVFVELVPRISLRIALASTKAIINWCGPQSRDDARLRAMRVISRA